MARAKRVKGRKPHIPTDAKGLLVAAEVHAGNIQDRDGAPSLLASIRHAFPWLRHVFADGAYSRPKPEATSKRIGRWTLGENEMPDSVEANRALPHRVSLVTVAGFSASPPRGNSSYRKVTGVCPDVGPLAKAPLADTYIAIFWAFPPTKWRTP